jgi:CubicO group peptidase (beta-lactamase class C family)
MSEGHRRKINWSRALGRFGWGILILIAGVNLFIIVTGRFYIYKAFANTVMVGRFGPAIDEHEIFFNRVVHAPKPQPWKTHPDYAANSLRDTDIEKFRSIGTVSFAVVYRDSLFFEQYWEGYNKASVTNSFSVAKSVVSMLIGVAIGDGKIESVDDPVSKYLPEFEAEGKEKITLRHLLTMSSGLDWDESGSDPLSDNAEAYYGWDLEDVMYSLDVKEDPGITFEYMSCNTQILAFVLEKATGKHVSEYLEEKLWSPLGMGDSALWNLDDEDGHEKAFCCLYATARDYLRLGSLYMKGGQWKGRQLVPENYVRESLTPAKLKNTEGNLNVNYGFQWWLDTYKGMDVFYARGILGQYIICIPSKELVIFRAGHERGDKLDTDHPEDLYWYIDAALQMIP